MKVVSLTTLLRMVATLSLIRTRAPLAWRINGRVTYRVTIASTRRKYGIRSGPEKKPDLCGQFGTKLLPSMSGVLASHRPQSLSNVCFASLILVSPSNTNFEIASRPGVHGDGPR